MISAVSGTDPPRVTRTRSPLPSTSATVACQALRGLPSGGVRCRATACGRMARASGPAGGEAHQVVAGGGAVQQVEPDQVGDEA